HPFPTRRSSDLSRGEREGKPERSTDRNRGREESERENEFRPFPNQLSHEINPAIPNPQPFWLTFPRRVGTSLGGRRPRWPTLSPGRASQSGRGDRACPQIGRASCREGEQH